MKKTHIIKLSKGLTNIIHSFSLLECLCNSEGSTGHECNDLGHCNCRPNVDGNRCDSCSDGFFNFPGCEGEFCL